MGRPGYVNVTLSKKTGDQLDKIMIEENCESRAEVIRKLISFYNDIIKPIKANIPEKFRKDVEKL